MKKVVRNILICLYFIIAFLVTYSLMTYNSYNIAEFKNKYVFTMSENTKKYKKSDLLVLEKNNKYKIGDNAFYYEVKDSKAKVKISKIKNIESVSNNKNLYVLDNGLKLDNNKILGVNKNLTVYPIIGSLYTLLTSRWGYLIIVILPMLSLFIIEIVQIIKELRKQDN